MPNADLPFRILLLTGLLGVLIAAGYLLVRHIRKRFSADADDSAFTLQNLREMRARGEITEREYESMRAGLLGTMAAPPRTPLPKPRPDARGSDPGGDDPVN